MSQECHSKWMSITDKERLSNNKWKWPFHLNPSSFYYFQHETFIVVINFEMNVELGDGKGMGDDDERERIERWRGKKSKIK